MLIRRWHANELPLKLNTPPADSIVRQPLAAMRLFCAATTVGFRKTSGKSLTTSLKHRLSLQLGSGDWPALALFESLPRPLPPPIKQPLLRELRRPGRSSSVLRLALGTCERSMSLARGGFMFTTARKSRCLRFTRLFGAPIGALGQVG